MGIGLLWRESQRYESGRLCPDGTVVRKRCSRRDEAARWTVPTPYTCPAIPSLPTAARRRDGAFRQAADSPPRTGDSHTPVAGGRAHAMHRGGHRNGDSRRRCSTLRLRANPTTTTVPPLCIRSLVRTRTLSPPSPVAAVLLRLNSSISHPSLLRPPLPLPLSSLLIMGNAQFCLDMLACACLVDVCACAACDCADCICRDTIGCLCPCFCPPPGSMGGPMMGGPMGGAMVV